MESRTRMPDFLVIGAMKSGTTSLYNDLITGADIFLPDKESNILALNSDVKSQSREYGRLYHAASAHQVCGEFSTLYAMRPDYEGIARRAFQLTMHDLKIIYLVREPVSRAISHHFHMHSRHDETRMEADINQCVKSNPSLIQYGQYSMQLAPWIDMYGKESIKVICFEEYIKERIQTVCDVRQFLGLVEDGSTDVSQTIHNRSDGKPVLNDTWSSLTALPLYRQLIRPLLSSKLRDRIRRWILPTAPPRPASPSIETVDYIIEQVHDDACQLQQIMQRDQPLWDFEEIRTQYLAQAKNEQQKLRSAA